MAADNGLDKLGDDSSEWFLRISDGLTYGPIPLPTLADWAAHGRVAAGNEISKDRERWIAAETLPDLKMDWVVEMKNGEQHGPFNLLAAPYLVTRGVIEPDVRLHNLKTGKELSAESLLKSVESGVSMASIETSLETSRPVRSAPARTDTERPVESRPAVADKRAAERIGKQHRESLVRAAGLQDATAALATERIRHKDIRSTHDAKKQELAKLIATMSEDLEKKNHDIAARTEEIATLKKDFQDLKDRSRRNEKQLADKLGAQDGVSGKDLKEIENLKGELAEVRSTHAQVAGGNENRVRGLADEVARLETALSAARDAATNKEKEFAARVAGLEKEVAAAKAGVLAKEQEHSWQLADLKKQVETEQAAGVAAKSVLEDKEKELAAAVEQAANKEKDSSTAAELNVVLEAKIAESKAREKALSARIEKLEEDASSYTDLLEKAKSELDKQRQAIKDRENDDTSDVSELKKKVEILQNVADTAKDALEKGRRENATREKELSSQVSEFKKAASESAKSLAELKKASSPKSPNIEPEQIEVMKGELGKVRVEMEKSVDVAKKMVAEMAIIKADLEKEKAACADLERREAEAKAELADAKKGSPSSSDWYLKLEDGSVHGPVSQIELQDWASECRIGPDHKVSKDQKKWDKAKDVRALRMEWIVQLVDGGSFGPINMFAVHHLIEDGAVAPDAEIDNQKSGEKWKAQKLLTPEVMEMREEIRRLTASVKDKDCLLAEAKK